MSTSKVHTRGHSDAAWSNFLAVLNHSEECGPVSSPMCAAPITLRSMPCAPLPLRVLLMLLALCFCPRGRPLSSLLFAPATSACPTLLLFGRLQDAAWSLQWVAVWYERRLETSKLQSLLSCSTKGNLSISSVWSDMQSVVTCSYLLGCASFSVVSLSLHLRSFFRFSTF